MLETYRLLAADDRVKAHSLITKEAVEEMRRELGIVEKPQISPMSDFFQEAMDRMRTKGIISGISTGLPTLDDIDGGLDPEELVVVTGETGMGKTNLAMNVLYHVADKGIPVLFFTLEMSKVEVVQRFYQLHGERDSIAEYPVLFHSGTEDVDVRLLRECIRAAVADHGVKVVAIDHLHYFARSAENNREQLEVLTREIKLMAREFQVTVILIAHTRKLSGGQERPYLADIKDTSSVAQDADQVIIVWRNTRTTDPADRYTLHFEVAKNRLKGKCDTGSFRIDKNYRLIDDKTPNPHLLQEAERTFDGF